MRSTRSTMVLVAMLVCGLVESMGLPVLAMENHSGVLRNQRGTAIGGATVTVYLAGTTTPAALYSDNGVTAKANPFTTDTFEGRYNFYAANGVYDIVFRYQGTTFNLAHTKRIALFDPTDSSGGTSYATIKDETTSLPQRSTLAFTGSGVTCVDAGTQTTCTITGGGGGGTIGGTTGAVDNGCLRADGTGGATIQGSPCTIGDDGTITTPGNLVLSGAGTSVETTTEGPNPGPPTASGQHNRYLDSVTGKITDFKYGGVPIEYVDTASDQPLLGKIIDGQYNTIILIDDYWFPTARCDNATASTLLNLPTTNAATVACDTGTNQFSAYLQFADAANQSAHFSFILPDNYAGTGIGWNFRYHMDAGTTGNVGLCAQMVRVPTSASRDPAFPALSASNCVYSAISATAGQEAVLKIPVVSCLSCIAGDRVMVRVSRDGNGTVVSDTATGNMRLTFTGPRYAKRSR